MGKPTMWFSNRSDTNRAVLAQKQARSLNFWILVGEGLENKGAVQFRDYREANPRLCFRIRRLLVFSRGGSNKIYHMTSLFSSG